MSAHNILSHVSDRRSEQSPIHLAPLTDWSVMSRSEHIVQFYEEDRCLIQSVASFIGAGFKEGEAAIIIATQPHRDALDERLQQDGFDPAQLRATGQFYALDAAEILAKFMSAGSPDPRLFLQTVGNLVASVIADNRPLRAFGEMVALLWQEGNTAAAIRLEELWNDLGNEHRFSLLCAYPMRGFCGDSHGQPFAHICSAHTRVIPAESYSANTNTDDRLRTITILQQKAASLEAEITRRKQIEKELAQQKRELSDFLQNANEGIHQVSAEGTILWANRAELDLLGYSAAEYIGHDIRQFHTDAPVIAHILDKLSRGEALHDYEARLNHKDGSIRHVSINSNVYWDADKFLYSRCFTRDITDRKRAAEILEQTVAERTAKLSETIAELEAFSYSVSHDMRSPLRAMQGYSRAVLKDYGQLLPEDGVEALARIERAANRLDLLVRDILRYSKIAKGEIQLGAISLESLLMDVMEQHPELREARGFISIQQPLHTVMAHQAYLGQCVTNLLENALKFVSPGTTPSVRIGSQAVNGHIRISVTDNGIGIAPEHRDRIFQIFGRVNPDKAYPGTGIGLAIVKKAVARMGGEAGFDSQPGKGSTFWFTLRHP